MSSAGVGGVKVCRKCDQKNDLLYEDRTGKVRLKSNGGGQLQRPRKPIEEEEW